MCAAGRVRVFVRRLECVRASSGSQLVVARARGVHFAAAEPKMSSYALARQRARQLLVHVYRVAVSLLQTLPASAEAVVDDETHFVHSREAVQSQSESLARGEACEQGRIGLCNGARMQCTQPKRTDPETEGDDRVRTSRPGSASPCTSCRAQAPGGPCGSRGASRAAPRTAAAPGSPRRSGAGRRRP